jgi:hypothetical protein
MDTNTEDKRYYVYHIINPITFRLFYVGKGVGYRCRQHLTDKPQYAHNKRLNGYIRNLINNNTPPTIIKIAENLPEEYAYELEELEIKKYGRVGFEENGILLNILESGRPPSFKGENHPFYGKKHTEESKRKMSETEKKKFSDGMVHPLLGKNHSQETIDKIKKSKKGQKPSEKAIQNSIESRLGKPQTDYQKQRAREANEKTWRIITPEGEEVIITNLRQYSLERGLDPGNMMHVAAGRQKQHKGYKVFKLT